MSISRFALYRKRAAAHVVLIIEQASLAILPVLAVLLGFYIYAMIGPTRFLPDLAACAILVGFAGILLFVLWQFVCRTRWPSPNHADRRLEQDSKLPHRPLALLRDQMAAINLDNPVSIALWEEHLRRARGVLGTLRLSLPVIIRPARRPVYPWALLIIAAIIMTAHGFGEIGPRLASALRPFQTRLDPRLVEFDLWIRPASYTHSLPIHRAGRLSERRPSLLPDTSEQETGEENETRRTSKLSLISGSEVEIRLTGFQGGGLEMALGSDRVALSSPDPEAERAVLTGKGIFQAGDNITVLRGDDVLASWPVAFIPDQPPRITIKGHPSASRRGKLAISFIAHDDFGIEMISAKITLDATNEETASFVERWGGEVEAISVPFFDPPASVPDLQAVRSLDLATHRWAGLRAKLRLIAHDGKQQTGQSDAVSLVLPERKFTHPIAKRLALLRKTLQRYPDAKQLVADALATLQRQPNSFQGDVVVYLGLRVISQDLMLSRDPSVLPEAAATLWALALRLDGQSDDPSARKLAELREALRKAIAEGAPQEEIQRLIEETRAALEDWMRQKMQEAMNQPLQPMDENSQQVSTTDLDHLFDQMSEFSELGARDAMQDLLDQLDQVLDNLRFTRPSLSRQQAAALGRIMQALAYLDNQQRALMDETEQLSSQGDQSSRRSRQSLSSDQQSLLRALNQLLDRLGKAGKAVLGPLNRAERAMRGAGEALEQGRLGDAAGQQGDVLRQLRDSAGALLDQFSSGGSAGSGQLDPLGRRLPGQQGLITNRGGDWDVPDNIEMQQARDILQELRRRSGDLSRHDFEREYLLRLLDPYSSSQRGY